MSTSKTKTPAKGASKAPVTAPANKGLNYNLTINKVNKGESPNGPYLKIRATTTINKKEKTITAMLFLNRGKKGEKQAPTKASQAAWDKFSKAKKGSTVRAYGEVRPVKSTDGKTTSAYFAIRSLSAALPVKAKKSVEGPSM